MAMTKKEREYVERLLEEASLRITSPIEPDVDIPDSGIVSGWMYYGVLGTTPNVAVSCSSMVSHSIGNADKTTSQRPIRQYSTKLLALRALRYAVERDCARRLRRIDVMTEKEIADSEGE